MAIPSQKSVVEGIVQALFGAAAGGHLAGLTAQASTAGNSAVAADLATVAPLFLGVSLASNADFVETFLNNLGLASDTAQYTTAAAWATGQLNAGVARGTVVAAAVEYLLALDSSTSSFYAVATALQESVALAVTWSEGEGKDTLAIADLTAYIASGQFTLTAGLDAKEAAEAAVAAALEAFNTANETEYTDVADAQDDLDTLVDDAVDALVDIVADWAVANTAKKNAAEIAAVTVDLEEAVAAAEDDVTAAADDIDAVDLDSGTTAKVIKGIKAVVAALETQDAAATAATDAATAVGDAEDEAAAYYDAFAIGGVDSTTDYIEQDADDVYVLNADANADDVLAAMTGGTAAIVELYLASLQTLADALNAQAEADAAETAADDLVTARLAVVEAYDSTFTNGTALTNEADAYADALTALATAEDELAALPEAIAAYEAAAAEADALTALTDAVTDATTALEDNGFVVVDLADAADEIASAEVDLYFVTDMEANTAADITGFGADGADKIYIGSDFVLGGATDKANVLEVFMDQDGDNVVVTIETETFGYSTAATDDDYVITLVGVDLADVSFANGVLTAA